MGSRLPRHLMPVIVTLLLSGSPPAAAQVSGGAVPIQLFRPSMDSKGVFSLDASQVLGHLEPSFGLVVSYARRPLALSGPGASSAASYEVDNLVTGSLHATVGLWGHVELGLALPVTTWSGSVDPDPRPASGDGAISTQGVGDLALLVKGRLLDTSRRPVGLALSLAVDLPTGDDSGFLGAGHVGLWPRVIVDAELWRGRVHLVANAGALLQLGQTGTWVDNRACPDQGSEASPARCGTGRQLSAPHLLTYGVGAALSVVPGRLDLALELSGRTGLDAPFDADALNSAHELLAGVKLYLGRSSYLMLGVGCGLRGDGANHAMGSPDLRAFGGFVFEPAVRDRDGDGLKDDVDRCPDRPEDADDFEDSDGCPDPDNDRDSIPDVDDRCPNEPEDRDGREDQDGCPEADPLDRDGDGIHDTVDRCPDQPEDVDRFEDSDGCPDPDNDRDRVLDVDDLCPNRPEDRDRFEDSDGCPDPDNDRDRILDVDDLCPNEPETYNKYRDRDGCPDKAPARFGGGTIVPLGRVHFETDRAVLRPESYPTLDAVVWALSAHPQILLLEIQGHADERGSASHNLRLTRDRAHAVRRYLERKGVDPARLRSRGYGEQRPRDTGRGPDAWSHNRRVEFVILRRR